MTENIKPFPLFGNAKMEKKEPAANGIKKPVAATSLLAAAGSGGSSSAPAPAAKKKVKTIEEQYTQMVCPSLST